MASPTTEAAAEPHGVKRRGDDSIDSEQRLAKRFHLLNLAQNGTLWTSTGDQVRSRTANLDSAFSGKAPSNSMQVDDTKDRVYIHNLDEELESVDGDSEEEKIIFIPDIERHLNKIPKRVLIGDDQPKQTGSELVLYSVPSSISVPEEHDSVRKAILESRARARERQRHNYHGDEPSARDRGPETQAHAERSHTEVTGNDYNDCSDWSDAMELG